MVAGRRGLYWQETGRNEAPHIDRKR